MALFIEPGVTTVEVAGEEIEIKILTGRDRIKISRHYLAIAQLAEGKGEDDHLTHEATLDMQDLNYQILEIGLNIDPDTINPLHWGALVGEVWKANKISGEDSKN